MDALTTDPLAVSDYVRALTTRVRSFDDALTAGPVGLDPFQGQTTIGKTLREHVLASRDFEPIRASLVAHIDRLLERRINLSVSLEESVLLTQAVHPPSAPFDQAGTLATRRMSALATAADTARRDEAQMAFRTIERDAVGVSAVRVLRYERLLEIQERLGARLSSAVDFSGDGGQPSEDQQSVEKGLDAEDRQQVGGVATSAGGAHDGGETIPERLARSLLAVTRDASSALLEPGFWGLVAGATGTPATEGWPARLAADSLLSLFGGSWLLAGDAPVRVGLPERVCAASFPRAAVRFGGELVRAATPSWLPFVLARTPSEVHGRAVGRLLALWLLSPACARRRLGLGAEGRARHARGATRLLLAETRLLCARTLLAEAGRRSRSHLDDAWGELGIELCGSSWGAPLGVLAAKPDAAADLVAHLWALARQAEMVRAFDEDYLDNPRAREALLADIHATEPSQPSAQTLEEAGRAMVRGFMLD